MKIFPFRIIQLIYNYLVQSSRLPLNKHLTGQMPYSGPEGENTTHTPLPHPFGAENHLSVRPKQPSQADLLFKSITA